MLEPDVIALLESDAVILVGTVDAAGVPEAARGWGVQVLDGTEPRVRVLVPLAARRTHENLASTGRIAVTVTDVTTLQSAQVKGRLVGHEDVSDTDDAEHRRYFASLAEQIHDVEAVPLAVLENMRPGSLTAVIAAVHEVYDQTPGPAAGVQVAPVRERS